MTAACFYCGLSGAVFTCSRCRRVHFCGPACQKGGWKRHRLECLQAGYTSGGSSGSSSPRGVGGNPSILQALAASKLKAHPPHRIRACAFSWASSWALQGEVDVEIPRDASLDGVRKVVCRAMFGCSDCSRSPICSIEHFWQQVSCDGIVVSDGFPCRRGSPPGSEHASRAAASSPRYDRSLVGASVVPSLLPLAQLWKCIWRASVPVVLTGTDLAQQAVERWNFDYLERYLADVDNFFVLCAPASSKGRFAYYDLSQDKNPCGYKIAPTNERREMRFPNFRQKVAEARPKKPPLGSELWDLNKGYSGKATTCRTHCCTARKLLQDLPCRLLRPVFNRE
eukprot:s5377_g1.t1